MPEALCQAPVPAEPELRLDVSVLAQSVAYATEHHPEPSAAIMEPVNETEGSASITETHRPRHLRTSGLDCHRHTSWSQAGERGPPRLRRGAGERDRRWPRTRLANWDLDFRRGIEGSLRGKLWRWRRYRPHGHGCWRLRSWRCWARSDSRPSFPPPPRSRSRSEARSRSS